MAQCHWRQDDEFSDAWFTECGQAQTLTVGTPRENDYAYCPFCGSKLVEVPFTAPVGDEDE